MIIDKAIFWNIRSVNTQNAFDRLIDLKRRHNYAYIALMEPFQGPQDLDTYRRRLGMKHALVNSSTKI